MEKQHFCVRKVFRNPLCYIPCIVIVLIIVIEGVYIGVGLEQCVAPVQDVVSQMCVPAVNDISSNHRHAGTSLQRPVPVHQLGINLNVSTLNYNSKDKWHAIYPNYTLYNATMARDVIVRYYPHLLELYDSYPDDIQRADLARIAILHHYGGIYADLDAFPAYMARDVGKVNLDDIKAAYMPVGTGNVSVNFFFMTNANNSFMEYLLNSYETYNRRWKWIPLPYLRVFLTTGPCALTISLRNWQKMWQDKGISPAPSVVKLEKPRCFLIHETGRVWLSIDGLFFNWVGDNTTTFMYCLVLFSTFAVLLWVFFAIKKPRCCGEQQQRKEEQKQNLIEDVELDSRTRTD